MNDVPLRNRRRGLSRPIPRSSLTGGECHKTIGRDRGDQIKFVRDRKVELRGMCKGLSANDWVLFRTTDRDEPLWLGRAVPRVQWNQAVTYSNDKMRRVCCDDETGGVQADPGECLVFVQWYDFLRESEYGREYKVSAHPYDVPTVNNYKDLVAVKFDSCVHQLVGDQSGRRSLRRLARRVQGVAPDANPYAAILNSTMTTNEEAHAQERGRTYEIETAAYSNALLALDGMAL